MRNLGTTTILFVFVALAGACAQEEAGENEGLRPGQIIDLQRQLETGLRARLPAEFDYLEDIVRRVQLGQIPDALVRKTFAYARKQRPYPIQYFSRALRILGARQGVNGIPALQVRQQR